MRGFEKLENRRFLHADDVCELPLPPEEIVVVAHTVLEPITLQEAFSYHSKPDARHRIFLDFDGHTTENTQWNFAYTNQRPIYSAAYDTDGNPASFTESELTDIKNIWAMVAEDFMPFDVDVTTEQPPLSDIIKSDSSDTRWGVRVVIGGSWSDWYPNPAGGVAYLGAFNAPVDLPVFVFENNLGNPKNVGEAASHEVGHALYLRHDGGVNTGYYQGHNEWAPIMGVAYGRPLSQWSKGEYTGANNTEDDLTIITTENGFGYRADDFSEPTLLQNLGGIIERNTDVDVFTVDLAEGLLTVNANPNPLTAYPNLNIMLSVYDANNTLVAFSAPDDTLSASINAVLPAGSYRVEIEGAGKGDPYNGGYSDYGSLGYYTIEATYQPGITETTVTITTPDMSVVEGNGVPGEFPILISRYGTDISSTTLVDWAIATYGTPTVDASDFLSPMNGTITFGPGEYQKFVYLQTNPDNVIEGDERFQFNLNSSNNARLADTVFYGLIANDDVAVAAAVLVTGSDLRISENGTRSSFKLALNSKPTADVRLNISSTDTTEGLPSVSYVVFTPDNWNVQQTVFVNPVDDTLKDGNKRFRILISSPQTTDVNYSRLGGSEIWVTNQDNEKGKGRRIKLEYEV